jgi:hypothetical protein
MSTDYLGQKFSEARRALMIPHYGDAARALAGAINSCATALHNEQIKLVKDEEMLRHLDTIRRHLPAADLPDPTHVGISLIKAQMMTEAEKAEFSRAVDILADWAHREFWLNQGGKPKRK